MLSAVMYMNSAACIYGLDIPYSAKRWWWKTLANPTEDCIGEKNIGECIPHKEQNVIGENGGNNRCVCDVAINLV